MWPPPTASRSRSTQLWTAIPRIFYTIYFAEKQTVRNFIPDSQKNSLKERFSDHRGYVNTSKLHQATGAHWNLPGHKVSDMGITVLEKIKSKDPFYRNEREKYFINKFEAITKSLNKNDGG